jgi:tetratricopeptide (TPR) repeat protein
MLDLISSYDLDAKMDWTQCVNRVTFPDTHLDLISAGQDDVNYAKKLQTLDWREAFRHRNIGSLFENMRNQIKQSYDFILIDSRTGLTDIGDICTSFMADSIIMIFVTNDQNLYGTQAAFERAKITRTRVVSNRGHLVAIPVLGRDEVYNEVDRSDHWKQENSRIVEQLAEDWCPEGVSGKEIMQTLFIPYVAKWSFGERLPVVENPDEIRHPASISASFARIAALISSQFTWEMLKSGVGTLELEGERALIERRRLEIDEREAEARQRSEEQKINVEQIIEGTVTRLRRTTRMLVLNGLIAAFSILVVAYTVFYLYRLVDDRESLAIAAEANTRARLELSDAWSELGAAREAEGDLVGAIAGYTGSKNIAEELAAGDPANAELQRRLSENWDRLGDVRLAQGVLDAALEAFTATKDIRDRLASADPTSSEWQRDLSISWSKLGGVRSAQGDLTAALQAITEGKRIADRLAAADPGNALWQRDLSVSWNKLGDVRSDQGDLPGALQAFTAAKNIADRLAAADPGNAEWQRDLIVSHWKLADLLERTPDRSAEAAAHWAEALAIARTLADTGRLAPIDANFVETLKQRLAATGQDPPSEP